MDFFSADQCCDSQPPDFYHWLYILVYNLFFANLYYDMLIRVFIGHHPFNVIGLCDVFNIGC